METAIYSDGKRFNRTRFKKEDELVKLMIENYKSLFGRKTIFIRKTKIKTEGLGNSVPDGFLFDLKDLNNPQFYLIEVELADHDFDKHIFPQVTRFISFFNSSENRKKLTEKIFESITSNKEIEKGFRDILGTKEIFKLVTDAVENSQNILLILDKEKPEIAEVKKAYVEWDRLVKIGILSSYSVDENSILTLSPPFEEVDIADIPKEEVIERYDENYNLESANENIKEIYQIIKEKMLKFDKTLTFNPQKYYISIIKNRNFAYIQIRRTKIHIVITLPYKEGKKMIKKHTISQLSKGIQDFYNSECFRVTIENKLNLKEIINLLKINANETE